MKITSIALYKGRTYCVEIDDERKLYFHRDIVSDYGLKYGMEMDESELEKVFNASEKRRARERALYLLDYRDYSYIELLEKLEKNYEEDICFEVLDYLAEKGFVNDRRYAENLARKLFEIKKYGVNRVRQEMKRKGLTDEIIEEMLEEYEGGANERIEEIINKKYSRYLGDYKGEQKVKAALVRLGYRYSEINEVIKGYSED